MGSLVDPSYDLVDPTPDVHSLFVEFNDTFFEGRLAGCELKWSTRMTTCAGICAYEGRGGLCSIRLSEPLLKLRPRSDLVETLLHEMIHAFLFVTARNRDRDGHGPEFQSHMNRINQIAGTNITIYHSFHAEVRLYKTHHWRCEGPCRDRRPFFGWVKRASNRAPSKNDLWWSNHQATCGGTFVKVSEPEGFRAKGAKGARKGEKKDAGEGGKKKDKKDPKKAKTASGGSSRWTGSGQPIGGGAPKRSGDENPLSKQFPSTIGGQTLGGGWGRSRLLDLLDQPSKKLDVVSNIPDIIVLYLEESPDGRNEEGEETDVDDDEEEDGDEYEGAGMDGEGEDDEGEIHYEDAMEEPEPSTSKGANQAPSEELFDEDDAKVEKNTIKEDESEKVIVDDLGGLYVMKEIPVFMEDRPLSTMSFGEYMRLPPEERLRPCIAERKQLGTVQVFEDIRVDPFRQKPKQSLDQKEMPTREGHLKGGAGEGKYSLFKNPVMEQKLPKNFLSGVTLRTGKKRNVEEPLKMGSLPKSPWVEKEDQDSDDDKHDTLMEKKKTNANVYDFGGED